MKPSANEMRYGALEQDWNRLRDYEREWRIFGERVGRVLVLIAAVAGLTMLVSGCDSPERKCGRWQATAEGYTMCIKDPGCRMGHDDYVRLNEAKSAAILHCPVKQ